MSSERKPAMPEPQPKSPSETPMCKILVGEAEVCFMVNEGYLQNTSFFAKHGQPKRHGPNESENAPPRHRSPTVENTGSYLFLPEGPRQTPEDSRDRPVDLTDTDADFELKGQFYHCRSAFMLFIDHLHGKTLDNPEDEDGCKDLFKLYALAQCYDVQSLRIVIIQRLQRYYRNNLIPLTDLTYLVENWPNDATMGLATYLIAQFAFELATSRNEDRSINDEMAVLFAGENIVLARRIFEAVLEHVKPNKSIDPSRMKKYYSDSSV